MEPGFLGHGKAQPLALQRSPFLARRRRLGAKICGHNQRYLRLAKPVECRERRCRRGLLVNARDEIFEKLELGDDFFQRHALRPEQGSQPADTFGVSAEVSVAQCRIKIRQRLLENCCEGRLRQRPEITKV